MRLLTMSARSHDVCLANECAVMPSVGAVVATCINDYGYVSLWLVQFCVHEQGCICSSYTVDVVGLVVPSTYLVGLRPANNSMWFLVSVLVSLLDHCRDGISRQTHGL